MGRSRSRKRGAKMVFLRQNYQWLIASILLLIVGFTTMRIENEVDGFLSLYISPILLFLGYVGVIFAILRNKENDADSTEASS